MRVIMLALVLFISVPISTFSQTGVKVYPTHWWTGMKNRKLQLMVYRPEGLTTSKTAVVSNNSDIRILKYHKPASNHYLFIDVEIAANARPGVKNIRIANLAL